MALRARTGLLGQAPIERLLVLAAEAALTCNQHIALVRQETTRSSLRRLDMVDMGAREGGSALGTVVGRLHPERSPRDCGKAGIARDLPPSIQASSGSSFRVNYGLEGPPVDSCAAHPHFEEKNVDARQLSNHTRRFPEVLGMHLG